MWWLADVKNRKTRNKVYNLALLVETEPTHEMSSKEEGSVDSIFAGDDTPQNDGRNGIKQF